MRAVQVSAFATTPRLVEVPAPSGGPGRTLVRIGAGALGHLDQTVAGGTFPMSPPLPYSPGVEGSGTVLESATLAPGQAVWIRGAGVGVAETGTLADVVAVPDAAVHTLPEGADPLLASCFFSPATSASAAVHHLGRLDAGERVAVTGAAGAVGALAVQLALQAGAVEVVASVSREERIGAVPVGARAVVGAPDGDPVDLLIDTIGGPGLAERILRVKPGGRVVLVGYTAGTSLTLDLPRLMAQDVSLLPLNAVRRAPQAFAEADELLLRLSRGELTLPVTALPAERLDEAWELLGSGRAAGRVVLTF